jgi:hypothetical protein
LSQWLPPEDETEYYIEPGLSFQKWMESGRHLKKIERGHQWWIGDWLAYGEKEYPEKYEIVAEQTGYARRTLKNLKKVSKAVAVDCRRADLSWGHHRKVVSLTPAHQVEFLEKASKFGWTIDKLRAEVRQDRFPEFAAQDRQIAEECRALQQMFSFPIDVRKVTGEHKSYFVVSISIGEPTRIHTLANLLKSWT